MGPAEEPADEPQKQTQVAASKPKGLKKLFGKAVSSVKLKNKIKVEAPPQEEPEEVPEAEPGSESASEILEPEESLAPKVGDDVVSFWKDWQFFLSNIVDFDTDELKYQVAWKDGDTTGTIQPYDLVAKDVVPPNSDTIGIGTEVLFEQGEYALDGVRGFRWHLGEITEIKTDENRVKTFSGKHKKGAEDGKWVTFRGYEETFEDYGLERLRIFPTAFEALAAFQAL